ncbi:hypothetical protein A2W24_04340 [Microgenomates group bacterium RBG_16_45_19]|nr:MAG: hypothetical protein A2W24_04340 [Microgenomates group bacterium RBG_16_45_19]
MVNKSGLKLILLGSWLIGLILSRQPVWAQTGDVETQKREIAELEQKLEEIKNQKQSLSQTLQYITTRVQLTQKEINKTQGEISLLEQQISVLEDKIGVLNVNLSKLSSVMINRLKQTYKNNATDPIMLLFLADGFNDFFRRFKYLQVSQEHDREVIFALEEARVNYDQQRQVKEAKQAEVKQLQNKLVSQKADLDKQQREKQALLIVTRNDERRYQEQLARAMAELNAIFSIVAGKGKETEAGSVSEGTVIASIIAGSSACSNGSHLHLEVTKDSNHLNPASFLSGKSVVWDNAPDGSFDFSGSWPWPVDDPVRITQGYGMTFYASTLRYYGGAPHTGLDMISNGGSLQVKAVKSGTLYRGAIACGSGHLRYVHVDHGDGYDTYYLHVNY